MKLLDAYNLGQQPEWSERFPYCYAVEVNGVVRGFVYRIDQDGARMWGFRNDAGGIYGTMKTRGAAVDALLSVKA